MGIWDICITIYASDSFLSPYLLQFSLCLGTYSTQYYTCDVPRQESEFSVRSAMCGSAGKPPVLRLPPEPRLELDLGSLGASDDVSTSTSSVTCA